jgi:hypothetical protein
MYDRVVVNRDTPQVEAKVKLASKPPSIAVTTLATEKAERPKK